MPKPSLLTELLTARTIQGLDGDDERFAKIERAAETVAARLRDEPPFLIRAVLAGLDPDISGEDPAILYAETALVAEWKSMASVFADKPIGWLRFILLSACERVATGNAAVILWLTAADTLPWVKLGKEEPILRRALTAFALESEKTALSEVKMPSAKTARAVEISAPSAPSEAPLGKVNRNTMLAAVAATACTKMPGQNLTNPNPNTPNQGQPWAQNFATRMAPLLADLLDAQALQLTNRQLKTAQALHANQEALVETLGGALTTQRRWVQKALRSASTRKKVEETRLNALWWAEALYSPTLRCSYRELPSSIAAIIMAVDLLEAVTLPTSASVGYLLAETVNRLVGGGVYDGPRKLSATLSDLREQRGCLPDKWIEGLTPPPSNGRLSMRDVVWVGLNGGGEASEAMRCAGIDDQAEMSLPALAHAVFRQEQAVRLAKADQ